MKFNLRDFAWLLLACTLAIGWWVDRWEPGPEAKRKKLQETIQKMKLEMTSGPE